MSLTDYNLQILFADCILQDGNQIMLGEIAFCTLHFADCIRIALWRQQFIGCILQIAFLYCTSTLYLTNCFLQIVFCIYNSSQIALCILHLTYCILQILRRLGFVCSKTNFSSSTYNLVRISPQTHGSTIMFCGANQHGFYWT